jgi:hypothetical protein
MFAASVEPSAANTPITVIPRMTRNPFLCFKGARDEPSNLSISIFCFPHLSVVCKHCETGSPTRSVYRTIFHIPIQHALCVKVHKFVSFKAEIRMKTAAKTRIKIGPSKKENNKALRVRNSQKLLQENV